MLVEDVFTPGTIPQYTYNPRRDIGLEDKVREALRGGGSILFITGTTKSGKTVLCDKIVGDRGVMLNGGEILKIGDFWQQIIDQLDLPSSLTVEQENRDEEMVEGTSHGGINIALAKFGGSLSGSTSTAVGTIYSQTRTPSLQIQSIKGLLDLNKVLVIDDFHYIRPGLQKIFIRALKRPLLRGLRVIVIAVPHKAFDVVRGEREMTGRVNNLSIPPWTDEELQIIAKKGFPFLNMVVDPELINRFAKESFSSPNLIQQFCKNYCLDECHVTNTLDKMTTFPKLSDERLKDFFKRILEKSVYSDEFDRLATGPKEHGRLRRQYVLKNGQQTVDLYKGLLIALSKTGPTPVIRINELRDVFISLLADGQKPPQNSNISSVLSQMKEIAVKNAGPGNPVIDWEKETSKIFVLDPYFAFYLKWAVSY